MFVSHDQIKFKRKLGINLNVSLFVIFMREDIIALKLIRIASNLHIYTNIMDHLMLTFAASRLLVLKISIENYFFSLLAVVFFICL